MKFLNQFNNHLAYKSLLFLCVFLPFQFALNPLPGFDLAIARVIILIIFSISLVIAFKNKDFLIKQNKITQLLLLFLAAATFSLFFSTNLFWSLRKLFFLFSIIPIYFSSILLLNTEERKHSAITMLILGATALATVATVQFTAQFIFSIEIVYAFLATKVTPFFLGNSFSQSVLAYPSWLVSASGVNYMRAVAMFPDPHMLSYYLGLLIPWSLALWNTSANKYSKWFLLSAILMLIANVCTFTRGGYIAIIAGAFVALPLVGAKARWKIAFGAFALIFLFFVAPHGPIAGRFASSFDVNEGSNQGRVSNWSQAISIVKQHPLGVGIGMYSLAIDPKADYRQPIYAHNLYLDIAAELGIVAMLIFVSILFISFFYFWKLAKKNTFYAAGVSSITIFAVHSLVETPLYSVHILSLICIIIAVSVTPKKYV